MAEINPVLILTHNALEMTKRCVESIRKQDIEIDLHILDNGSTDGTPEWFREWKRKDKCRENLYHYSENKGVSFGWNALLKNLFVWAPHVLVVNNDTILPSWFLRTLLSYDAPLVTGVSVGTMEEIAEPPPRKDLAPRPDFSAFLIRRECWEKVGPFDESMVHYCGDLDYHVRGYQLGVPMMNAGVPFYHERSSTLRLANPLARRVIELQADADRAAFRRKWGVGPGESGFEKLFEPKR